VFGSDYHITDRDILSKLVFSEACLKVCFYSLLILYRSIAFTFVVYQIFIKPSQEALRKYSVVPTVLRRIVSPTKIGNHTLTPECSVIISIQSVHHNDKFWTNPMVFDPTRFLDSNKIPEPYTFLPFIDGPRNCLGQYLALLESKMVISLIAERYKLTIIGKEYHDGSDPRHRFMVPIITKGSLNVSVSKR
jgi:cytochrome P450